MDLPRKLSVLADAAKYDASCASSGSRRSRGKGMLGDTDGVGICHSYTPDGRCVSLLKLLLTNYCIYDCRFCVNRVSSDTPRARFTVDEVVWLTIEFYKRNYIEGLFLSSGIIQSPDYTMERLAEIARRLREQERFNGYIHLKAIPGADPELLARAGTYADRLSANIELPTESDLAQFAPEKTVKSVDLTMSCIKEKRDEAREERKSSRHAPQFAPAGQSTQLIVGATPSSDATILAQSSRLYRQHQLKRVYYSAFSPIPFADGDLPATTPPLIREHRLYQADWLMRFYGFHVSELTTEVAPDLSLDLDPKHAWALRNPGFFPVDINAAPRQALLRIPGVGVRNVNRILAARKIRSLRITDLRAMRVALNRAQAFIVTPDWTPPELEIDAEYRAIERAAVKKTGKASVRNTTPSTVQQAGISALFGEL